MTILASRILNGRIQYSVFDIQDYGLVEYSNLSASSTDDISSDILKGVSDTTGKDYLR